MIKVKIKQLWIGDRFRAYDAIWTLYGPVSDDNGGWARARKHGEESVRLKDRSFGYMGDNLCSFEPDEEVEFIPVSEGK